ncbi:MULTISPECIES: MarC family protein [Winogradskyella]|uniref:MarC family protein n=1 Tax=Winogradskyella TaxID=286104 RepID=UPI0015CBF223|nr:MULTISPECIES: MarC family protein [Winogradskyella]QXP80305.1 MarC family protein [Winogradskyella sp. HaHa_3_26]
MDDLITFALTVFTGFFAIMNPIAGIPLFVSLTEGADSETKERINKKATLTAFLIVSTFVVLGKFVFDIFGITIPAFKITGGILIFYIGFEMLQSVKSSVKHLKNIAFDEQIAISPLAIPLLAGPGAIVTAMNFVTDVDATRIIIVIIMFGFICALTYLSFRLSDFIVEKIGKNIIGVLNKIMGLIIAIIGTNMVIEGIKISFNLSL